MKNQEIVDLFNEIGDMLDILGEDRFRVISYHRAARAIEGLTADVEDLVQKSRLNEIPGVGSALAEKIQEYVTTGKVTYHEELRERLPPGVLDLLRVPGVGPKKVQVLWQKLGITDLDTLQKACETHRLRRLKGFGEKTEANILRGIQLVREGQSRALLWDAARVVDRVVAYLREKSPVERVEAAGSFRRMRETVGDVDLLAVAKDRAAVSRAFASMPGIREVVVAGDTKATVLVEYEDYIEDRPRTLQVDLRILEAGSWGAGLQYFTGSKDHNVHLRGMALDHGLKLNEYGVFRGEAKVAGDSEEGVYAALGLPWIPPELREDRGEIEAALKGGLPDLLRPEDIRGDFHVHTDATDGTESLEAMADAARKRGYAYVGISDHSVSQTVAFGLTAGAALERLDRVKALNRELRGFTILLGTECDILDGGEMDYPDDVLKEFDFAIASIHSKFTQPRKEMTARVVAAVENPHVNLLAHPTARLIGRRDPIDLDLEAVFVAAAKAGTAIELNAYPNRMDLTGPQGRAAKEAGCRLTVDTDSHASSELAAMRFGIGTARRAWATSADVVNAWPLEAVRAFFR
ncbi:MAG TPA: DNA polymerase/3'-5' exonuclease PolX [Thermoplasmata archaeon]|nr:DNA polymerase/3'-5' exonuclease PolX [Thermoplasmata archaeon]